MPRKKPSPSQVEHGSATKRKPPVKAQKKPAGASKANGRAKPARKPKAAPAVVLATAEGIPAYAVKRDPWRPSKYKPEFCEEVIEHGRAGKSRAWIAARIGVIPETLTEWMKKYPDFSDAMAYAKALEQQWWEDEGQSGLRLQGFGQSAWSRSMAARFPRDWADKRQVDHGITDEFAVFLSQIDGHGASLI